MIPPLSTVDWPRTHRLVMSHYPPINLYDDVADPRDWEALAAAQAHTNPRIHEEIGDLSLVPPERRLSGDGASWVMAAFTHISPDRTSRFSAGAYGVFYAADSLETALYEHSFHMGRFYARTAEPPGLVSEVRQLIGSVNADLLDLQRPGFEHLLDPEDYGLSQALADARRAEGSDGIVYPSVRDPGGACIAAFWPNVVTPPLQGDHLRYHWDGTQVTLAAKTTGDRATFVPSVRPRTS